MLSFEDEAELAQWLQTTTQGRGIVQECLASGRLWSRVLVKAYADGWIEVYGDHRTLVHIISLPNSTQRLAEVEAYADNKTPYQYRTVNYPSYIRASEKIDYGQGYHQFMAKQKDAQLDLAFIEGCTRCTTFTTATAPNKPPPPVSSRPSSGSSSGPGPPGSPRS
jgi:hypothetical protein